MFGLRNKRMGNNEWGEKRSGNTFSPFPFSLLLFSLSSWCILVTEWSLDTFSRHMNATKLWSLTGQRLSSCAFGVNIGRCDFPYIDDSGLSRACLFDTNTKCVCFVFLFVGFWLLHFQRLRGLEMLSFPGKVMWCN